MRTIGKEEIEALKRSVDLVALVRSHGVEVKRTGKSYTGRCPFHSPDTNPSFIVDPIRNLWKCFGACASNGKSGGDAIAFLMRKEGIKFGEALDRLLPGDGNHRNGGNGTVSSSKSPASAREKEGRELSPEPSPASGTLSEVERAKLLDAVVSHYETALTRSPRAQSYLKRRVLLVPEVLHQVRAGYADGSLLQSIAPKGETREKLIAIGVLTEEGREVMMGMVVVPLVDPKNGAVLSLYGRSITGRRHLYLKGELRGLVNGAAAHACEDLVVVESVLDALSLLVAGVRGVVPIYGTNGWTREHDRLLEGGAQRVILFLDNDDAGKRATESLAAKLGSRGLRVWVATLAGHKDPNEALVAGVDLDQVLAAAMPLSPAPETPPATSPVPAARYDVEDIEGGFLLTSGARRYRARGITGGAYEYLRVNVKLEDAFGTYVDTLDLYAARARRGFVVRAAKAFGLDEATVERELGYLVEAAEAWLATRKTDDDQGAKRPAAPELSDEERAEAITFLAEPRLLERAVEHMTRLGYVGEEVNKALGYLVIVSRKLEDPLSALILSQSGAGKSGLTEILERLTPPEDVVLFSRLTPQALYYMEKDFLCRKVVVIEERSGSEEADYSLRTLQSRKKLVLGVPVKDPRTGKTQTKVIEVLGPAVFLETSTSMAINLENSTRCFELYLDESVEQTKRIHAQQRRSKTLGGQNQAAEGEKLLVLHWNAQRVLRPLRVHIPFADAIAFPDSWLRTRRDHLRFLNLIEASAFLHQYQRPTPKGTEPGTAVEASVADYRVAYELAREVLGSTLADLKKPARELLDSMRALAGELGKERKLPPERVTVTRRELRERTGLPDLQVWRLLRELVELEYVEVASASSGRRSTYKLAAATEQKAPILKGLLRPEEIQKRLAQGR